MSEYRDFIYGWHKKASEVASDDPFAKFVFAYLSFICYLKTEYNPSPSSGDRQSVQKLKRDEDIKKLYFNKLDNLKFKQLIKYLEGKPIKSTDEGRWWDCDANDPLNLKSEFDGKIKSEIDYINIIEFIYRIRNNLFHGEKGPDMERDKLLVEYGYVLTKGFVEIFVERLSPCS